MKNAEYAHKCIQQNGKTLISLTDINSATIINTFSISILLFLLLGCLCWCGRKRPNKRNKTKIN